MILTAFSSLKSQTITIGSDTAEIGKPVIIPILFQGLNNIGAIDLKITYDSTVLQYEKDTNISTSATGVLSNPTTLNGNLKQLNISWLAQGSSGVDFPSGLFMNIKFAYNGGSTPLVCNVNSCEVADWDGNPIATTYTNGYIYASTGSNISIWNGTGSWSSVANWSQGIPGSNTSAKVHTGKITIDGVSECNHLILDTSTILEISPNKCLTVNGILENNGTIILMSDSTGTGSLIFDSLSIGNTGIFKVQQYISSSNKHLIATPVKSVPSQFYSINNINTLKFDEQLSNWQGMIIADSLKVGSGALLESPANIVLDYQDKFIPGTEQYFQKNLIYNTLNPEMSGFNLIGNPYTSAIDWNNPYWIKQNIDATVYCYQKGNYICWNGYIGELSNGIIPALQGFFIRVNSTNASLQIPKAARIHSTIPNYKTQTSIDNLLKIKVEGNGYTDFWSFNVNDNATNMFNPAFDAVKLKGDSLAPQLYSLSSDNHKLAIDIRDTSFRQNSINLGFTPGTSGMYKITASNLSSFAPIIPIFLLDKKDQSIHNLRNQSTYEFTSSPSDLANRFEVYFNNSAEVNEIAKIEFLSYIQDNILTVKTDERNATLEIITIHGQIIKHQAILHNEEKIQLPIKGSYILRLTSPRGIQVQKIIY